MRRLIVLAAVLSLTTVTARAQGCLSVSDGLGGVHLTCPDGRTGFLNNMGTGVLAGMIGNQPYATPSTNLAPPVSLPGVPGASFTAPPLTAPQVPSSYAAPSPVPVAPSLNPAPGLSALHQTYLQEQSAKAAVH